MKALRTYVGFDDDPAETVVRLLERVHNVRVRLESSPTHEEARELCLTTRALYLAVMDVSLEAESFGPVQSVVPELRKVVTALNQAIACNPENEAFIAKYRGYAEKILHNVDGPIKGALMAPDQTPVFVSYVTENEADVRRFRDDLNSRGIAVWLDKDDLIPGQRWKDAIRRAIRDGQHFIAVFSPEYCARNQSYMNEELNLAIDELRQRPHDTAWFIPVLLAPCQVPDFSIRAGETLTDLQYIDLSRDWDRGIAAIADVISNS